MAGQSRIGGTHADIIHHHLVEAAGAERALDNICDGLGSQDWKFGWVSEVLSSSGRCLLLHLLHVACAGSTGQPHRFGRGRRRRKSSARRGTACRCPAEQIGKPSLLLELFVVEWRLSQGRWWGGEGGGYSIQKSGMVCVDRLQQFRAPSHSQQGSSVTFSRRAR